MSPELRHRLTLGPLLAAAVIGALVYDLHTRGHWGISVVAFIAAVLGCREYVRLARSLAPDIRLAPVLACTLLLVVEGFVRGSGWFETHPSWAEAPTAALIIGLGLVWATLEQLGRRGIDGCFAHLGASVLGVLYLGLPLNLLLRLVDQRVAASYYGETGEPILRGGALLLVFLAAVKLGDVTAFFGGKVFGRHKLCPSISPGKTWEGFACSFIGAIGGSCLFAWLAGQWLGHGPFNSWWQPIIWGLVLGPLGVLGDLVESAMKRAAGRKDSGSSLPGFGGVLDLFDALVLAAPMAVVLSLLL